MDEDGERNKNEALNLLSNIIQTTRVLEKFSPLIGMSYDDPNYAKYELEYENLMKDLGIPLPDVSDIFNKVNQLELENQEPVEQEILDIVNSHMEPADEIQPVQKVISQQELLDKLKMNKAATKKGT